MTSDCSLAPVLETDRLLLRAHQLEDFPACAAMWADPAVVAHISGDPSSEEQSWARFLRYAGHWRHLGFGYWAVLSKEEGAFIGEVGLANYRRDTEPALGATPEAGWVLTRASHGRGYATEAVAAMLAWADATLDHPCTAAMVDPAHAASIRVARKVGYSTQVEGRYGEHEALFLYRERRGP